MSETVRESTLDSHETTPVRCNPEVVRWLEDHSKSYFNATKDNTFVDNKGVRRYLDNWVPVEEDLESHKSNVEDKNGVCKLYFKSKNRETKYVKFLDNWEKLWKSFEEDPSDEIAAQAPLLRIFIEFFYHQRTCQLMIFLVCYDIFIVIMIAITAGNPLGTTSCITNIFLQLLQLGVYLALKQLYTGYILYDNKIKAETDAPVKADVGRRPDLKRMNTTKKHKHSMHWFSTAKQMCVQTAYEMKSIAFTGIQIERKNNHRNYYNLLNIALKFLSVHNEVKVTDINFNRLSYIAALLSILSIVPAYVFYYYIYTYLNLCKFQFNTSPFCDFVYFYGIETGAGVVVFLQYYIFISSVFVGFVGLAYGGEIAYQLTHSWLDRYAELRRVSPSIKSEENSEKTDKQAPLSTDSESKGTTEGTTTTGIGSEGSKPALFRRPSALLKGQPGRQSVSTVALQTNALTDETFGNKITRDAYEQHLFFAAYMKEAGHLWSAMIVGLFVYMLYQLSGSIYFWVQNPNETPRHFAKDILYISVRVCIFVIYPVTCLAHANRYLFTIRDTFLNSAPSDYSILGGREDWTSFLTAVPAVWTLFGLWITWDRIFGTVWTMIVSAVAIGVTMATANVKM